MTIIKYIKFEYIILAHSKFYYQNPPLILTYSLLMEPITNL